MRFALLVIAVFVLGTATVQAQETPWAVKLFNAKIDHDFGNVPHGSMQTKRFAFSNPYGVPLDVVISEISCNCVTSNLSTQRVEPKGTGYVDVNMNTGVFTGPRTVRVKVTFQNLTTDPQYFSTAVLSVTSNSRPDVLLRPGEINFGIVPKGKTVTSVVDVEYAGNMGGWRVSDVETNDLPVDATIEPIRLANGRPAFRVSTTLKTTAPSGLLKGTLALKTNDPATPRVAVVVEANVQAALTISNTNVRNLALTVGKSKSVTFLLNADKDFRVTSVEGLGDGIGVEGKLPDEATTKHSLVLSIRKSGEGDFKHTLRIKTDYQTEPITVTVEGSVAAP
jgi:hypothetical protein